MSIHELTDPGVPCESLNVINDLGSRPLGMIDSQQVLEALQDPDTVTVHVGEEEVPALVPIEYAEGYDIERCHTIVSEADRGNVLYFTLPSQVGSIALSNELGDKLAARSHGYVFYDVAHKDDIPPILTDALQYAGKPYEEIPLYDELAELGNEQASISLYGFDFPAEYPEIQATTNVPTIGEWYDFYIQSVAEGKYSYDLENGVVLVKGDEISEDLLDQMWSVYVDRFQWLGEKHPVSMEDSKNEFASVLRSDKTLVSLSFEDGKPVCFTYLTQGAEPLYWLNQDFLADKKKMHMDHSQGLMFFPGIVASEQGTGYSAAVIGLIANTAFDTNAAYKVIFENTNRSEKYIPRLVQAIINRQHRAVIERPELLDRTIYGCVKFGEEPISDEQ